MGHLTSKASVENDAKWYFADAYWTSDGNRYSYGWPSLNYPDCVSIHYDLMDNNLRIKIRKWIEKNLSCTVIYDVIDHSYKKKTNRSSFVDNKWFCLYFDDGESALAFKLVFMDVCKPVTKYHPERPEDAEWVELSAADRLNYYMNEYVAMD